MKHYLEDHIIEDIKIAEDKKAMLFKTDKGDVIARAEGDCCSSTWIEHVELPMSYPAKVLSVEDVPMPDDSHEKFEYGEVILHYGYKIKTDKGDIFIDYRNASNGYYGGNLSWPDDDSYFYGGVYGQNVSENKWIEITI